MYTNMKMITIAMAVALSPILGIEAQTPFCAIATPESQGVSSKAILRWIDVCENDLIQKGQVRRAKLG